jgi:DNA-binding LacI/PurR family transcriptional regulator
MSKRVVLQDVADRAGVHLTTAARAMKNDPRVKAETLALIQKLAREMGYSPDPMLSALSVYRTAQKPSQYHGTIGWVTSYPTRNGWQVESFRNYREGAEETLARHGYRLEDFWLNEPGLTAKRASQILQSRGIRGLLICPLPVMVGHLSLEWERFASVTFGYSLARPSLHLVTTSHYQNMQICMRQLYHLGHRRIAHVTWDEISKRVRELWTAAYRTPPFPPKHRCDIPILDLKKKPDLFSAHNREVFRQWFETYKPDAILTVDRHILDWMRELARVPEDVAYVSPSLQGSNVDHAGALEPSTDVGRAAADFLVGLVNRGEFGLPRKPQTIMLEGTWQMGKTVENKHRAHAA